VGRIAHGRKAIPKHHLAIKYAPKPVVAAPQGLALGGGCEVSLHAAKIQAAAEAYIAWWKRVWV